MKRNNLIILTLGLALAGWSTLCAAITVIYPTDANHTAGSLCPALDGANGLNPDPVEYLPPPQAGQGVMAELANGNTPFPGWTFNVGGALNGTLTLNYYHSQFLDAHWSGGWIQATYAPDAGDPASLRFVQMVQTSDPLNGATSPYIDPFPNDDNLPFYDTEKDWGGQTFNDFSHRKHPPTSYVTWRGCLYIADWDGKTPGTVTVHDGVRWGFDAGCINIDIPLILVPLSPPSNPNHFRLTWPTNSSGGSVQTSTNLTSPTTWVPLTNDVSQSNGQYQVSVTTSSSQQFFRLAFSNVNTGAPPAVQPAYIRRPPHSQTVPQSHEAYFSVKADGSQPIGYQWFFNNAPILNATNRDLDFPQVQYTNQGVYFATVTNVAGGETSDPAQLTVVQDTNTPTLVSAAATTNLQHIIVTFSEAMDPATSQDTANYQVGGDSGPVQLINATASNDQSIVTLTPSPVTPLTTNSQYNLQASTNITDLATPPNHLLSGSSITFTTGP